MIPKEGSPDDTGAGRFIYLKSETGLSRPEARLSGIHCGFPSSNWRGVMGARFGERVVIPAEGSSNSI